MPAARKLFCKKKRERLWMVRDKQLDVPTVSTGYEALSAGSSLCKQFDMVSMVRHANQQNATVVEISR